MIGGATRKITDIGPCSKDALYVDGSSQSNLTPVQCEIEGVVPDREAVSVL